MHVDSSVSGQGHKTREQSASSFSSKENDSQGRQGEVSTSGRGDVYLVTEAIEKIGASFFPISEPHPRQSFWNAGENGAAARCSAYMYQFLAFSRLQCGFAMGSGIHALHALRWRLVIQGWAGSNGHCLGMLGWHG